MMCPARKNFLSPYHYRRPAGSAWLEPLLVMQNRLWLVAHRYAYCPNTRYSLQIAHLVYIIKSSLLFIVSFYLVCYSET